MATGASSRVQTLCARESAGIASELAVSVRLELGGDGSVQVSALCVSEVRLEISEQYVGEEHLMRGV